jgi:Mg2+-importing ATPase
MRTASRSGWRRFPFDHDRRLASVVVDTGNGLELVTKGAPEAVLDRCDDVPDAIRPVLDSLLSKGARVIAIGTRKVDRTGPVSLEDERGLALVGLLVFADEPRDDARAALARLGDLGIVTKVLSGDNPLVASLVCDELGLPLGEVLTGRDLADMDDDELRQRIPSTRVFARVTPEDKSRIIRAQRSLGFDVGFLGDGVNEAVALHDADVGCRWKVRARWR